MLHYNKLVNPLDLAENFLAKKPHIVCVAIVFVLLFVNHKANDFVSFWTAG